MFYSNMNNPEFNNSLLFKFKKDHTPPPTPPKGLLRDPRGRKPPPWEGETFLF